MRKLSDSLISLDRIVSLGQIGLLARVGGPEIGIVRQCALAERYALPMQIVIPASCPPRKSPFDKDSRNRHGSPPLRSSLGPHPAAVGPNHYHGHWPATTLRRGSSSNTVNLRIWRGDFGVPSVYFAGDWAAMANRVWTHFLLDPARLALTATRLRPLLKNLVPH